ncbi:Phytanoyl-CoA dioxygenase, peroxisomal [Pseudolycoriella hygida]|uniref:phytanoyl-CoA dioxygenase n=1 Tax=Pseudolycoriella hygida TaxID=35572 RepID=A0A9Q0MIT7_9DIPT|nr:Phytanoyl-CoA dioxygenase, peroxisomal [Pseudolycoriella hygida]
MPLSTEDSSNKMSPPGKKLIYTRDSSRLTFEQRCFYETNGYIVFRRLVPLDLLEKCSRRFDDIASGKVDKGVMTVMRDVSDRKAVNKIQDINHDEVLREYIEYNPMLDVIEAVTGPNIMAVHSMLIAKPPDSGTNSSKHPPHQDLYYFPFRPAEKIVAAWTAIEPCDTLNGCLFVSPGSHLAQTLYPHDYPSGANNKFYHGIQELPNSMNWIDLEMQPGDTVFFHPLLVHGSGVNKSNRTRKAISCHYAAGDCNYIDVRGTVQDNVAKEIVEVARKRFSIEEIDYADLWRMRSSLVRGIRSNLNMSGKRLVYTRDSGILTFEQRCFYEKNGYIVFPRLIPQNILTNCSQRFDDIVEGKVEKGNIIVMRDVSDRKSVNKVQDINHDDVFCQYIECKQILDVVEAITGPNIMAMHSMLIAKPPDSGTNSSKHPPHQDLYYFPFRPVDKIVAAWTAIEPCDTLNGCLFVAPGSHLAQTLYAHGYPPGANNAFYHGIQDLPSTMKWQQLEMQPGDTVFFHPLLVHGSGVNKSNRTRKAISCHYAAAECHYINVSGSVQDAVAKEIVAAKRKRYNTSDDMSFEDFFKLKSSLVRGMRSNL